MCCRRIRIIKKAVSLVQLLVQSLWERRHKNTAAIQFHRFWPVSVIRTREFATMRANHSTILLKSYAEVFSSILMKYSMVYVKQVSETLFYIKENYEISFVFQLCCDLDLNVRNGAELLDRLLKDTVTENSGNEKFDIVVFMQLLRERIYVKNSFVRQFLVSWVNFRFLLI